MRKLLPFSQSHFSLLIVAGRGKTCWVWFLGLVLCALSIVWIVCTHFAFTLFSLQPAADSVWGSDVDRVCMVTSFCVTFSKHIAILLCMIDCRRTEDNLHVCVSVHPQP